MKKTETNLSILYMIFAGLLVCANCMATKQVPIGTWFGLDIAITAGVICYPFTFLVTDIIGEIWGKKSATRAVIGGFIGQIIAIILIVIANYLPGNDPEVATMYNAILGSNWILTIGSLTACILSQSWDVWVFHRIRDRYIEKHGSTRGGKWIWNNASTMTSQFIDSVVFYIGLIIMLRTQGVVIPFNVAVITILVYWIIKLIIALLDTPIFYLLTRESKR